MRARDFITELYDATNRWSGGGGNGDWSGFNAMLKYELAKLGFEIEIANATRLRAQYTHERDDSVRKLLLDLNATQPQHAVLRLIAHENDAIVTLRDFRLANDTDNIEWVLGKIRSELAYLRSKRPLKEAMLTEASTDILYHYTNSANAARILDEGVFKLATSVGVPTEAQYAPRGYHYFLSTTRSRVGDYHRYADNGATLFVLDGRWLGQRYPTRAIDYWDRMWLSTPDRTSESEERVFSRDNTIPVTPVTAIHVLFKPRSAIGKNEEWSLGYNTLRWMETRKIIEAARLRDIPVYLYDSVKHWRTQNTRRAIPDPLSLPELELRAEGERYGRQRAYSARWLELIQRDRAEDLSPDAERMRYALIWHRNDAREQLSTDLHNARKPTEGPDYDSAVQIVDYMRRNRLSNVRELVDHLRDKWSPQ